MKEDLLNYFKQKNISCDIVDNITTNFSTFTINLNNINDFKKFNDTMKKELTYILKKNVSITISDKIEIIINNNDIVKNKCNDLYIPLGIKTDNTLAYIDFKNNPHWLIGGSTGSGKSVFLNNVILSLLENYENCIMFGFIDLKQIEFHRYNNLKYNVCNVCNTVTSAKELLKFAIDLMNERYRNYKNNNVLDIFSYNDKVGFMKSDRMLIIVIDELAELILQSDNDLLDMLQRILQLGRAAGVYLICATQRPSADILPGVLKVNFTTRFCFKVSSMYDSKTVINERGAEYLNGNGDGLLLASGDFKLTRFQGFSPIKDITILEQYKEC